MPFPFRRLPFLAIREMIQSMDIRAILFLSVLSKKSANFVMLSIPKNSLSADFTFRKNGFQFELMPKGFMKQAVFIFPVVPYRTENESVFIRFSKSGLFVQCQWIYTSKAEESIRKLFYHFSKIFKNSKFDIRFGDETREEFAMEMMRFAWENYFLLDHIHFDSRNPSSESIQELLNEGCHEQHISIKTKVPEDFKCTPPPGGYKFESFVVYDARWVNLDDFLQCREVYLWDGIPNLTMEYLNGLLKKIVNLECRIEKFTMDVRNHPCDFAQIVKGLSESAIQQNGEQQELQFKRKDKLNLLISHYRGYHLKMTII